MNTIARLDAVNWSWSEAGEINTARHYHRAIWVDSKLIIVGGQRKDLDLMPTEFCNFENNEFTCSEQMSTLDDYVAFPMLFAVSDDYRNC